MSSDQAALVPPDTQATLLLCAEFGLRGGPRPLSLTEYNALASWLAGQNRRPASLLGTGAILPEGEPGCPDSTRLRALLGRGLALATAVERWHRAGLWIVGRGEPAYPERLRRVLRHQAPPLLYGAGDASLLDRGGLAVIGSRDADESALAFTKQVGQHCAAERVQLISGGARGVDQEAQSAALHAGGFAVGVLSDRLDRAATVRENREGIRAGRLTLVSPYEPEAAFAIGRAMGRNKHIYALADHALIVRFTLNEGGTWAGAVERLAANQRGGANVPVFLRVDGNPPDGLAVLLGRGGLRFPESALSGAGLAATLEVAAAVVPRVPSQPSLFDAPQETEPPVPVQDSMPLAPAAASPPPPSTGTFYEACLPLLLRQLAEGVVGEKELPRLAERLEVQLSQLKLWLKRAVAEGVAEVTTVKRKKLYRPASTRGLDVGIDPALAS